MNYFVDTLSPFAWEICPGVGFRWYGLAYVIGFALGWWALIRMATKGVVDLDAKSRAHFMLGIVLGILIGGRLGYMLLYDWSGFVQNPLTFLRIWEGGMSSHGGFLGVAFVCWLFSRDYKPRFLNLTDAVCVMAPAGLLLGRLANFVNGELWGKIAYLPWAVIFPHSAPEGTPLDLIAPRHPSQLYEAFAEGVLLLIFTQLRYPHTMKNRRGVLTAEFLMLYGGVRIVCELFREPDASLIFGLSRGTFYSILVVVAGAFLWYLRRPQKEQGK